LEYEDGMEEDTKVGVAERGVVDPEEAWAMAPLLAPWLAFPPPNLPMISSTLETEPDPGSL